MHKEATHPDPSKPRKVVPRTYARAMAKAKKAPPKPTPKKPKTPVKAQPSKQLLNLADLCSLLLLMCCMAALFMPLLND